MLRHGFPDGGIGNIDAEPFLQGLEDVILALENIEVQAVVIGLHGDFHILIEEVLLALVHGVQQLHILNTAVDHGAAVGRDEAVGKVEAALHGPLQQGTAVFAQEAGQVVGGHFHGAGAGCPEPGGEAAFQIQQRLRRVLTHIGHALFALAAGLDHKLIICVLQEIFKVA